MHLLKFNEKESQYAISEFYIYKHDVKFDLERTASVNAVFRKTIYIKLVYRLIYFYEIPESSSCIALYYVKLQILGTKTFVRFKIQKNILKLIFII